MVGRKLRPTIVGRSLAFLPGALPKRNFWVCTVGRKLAKLRLGGLPAAITGDKKKLYSKDEYDSNAENEVHK
jgi:hypothetical protein